MSTVNCSKQQNDQFENLYISSHGEARNIKFGHQINIIERVPLGTLPQAVVMSLAHNHLTNLFISSYRGAAVIKFKQQKQLCDRSRQGTSPLGVVTSLPSDHVKLINLYISSYREAKGATFIHANAQVFIDLLFQIFCDDKILQERKILSWQMNFLQALVFVHTTS